MTNLIERLKFNFTGKKVPVMRVSEVDDTDGKILTLQDMGTCQDNPNTLFYHFENKGWEKKPGTQPVMRINAQGIKEQCWIVSERGETCELYTKPWKGPKLENLIGMLAIVDMIAIAMGLYPSMRSKMIFLGIGVLLGWWVIGPGFGMAFS
jgi:hypothetical protein